MTTATAADRHYRVVGDLSVKGKTTNHGLIKGKKVEISYGNKKTTNFDSVSIIQARQPMTPKAPYFLVEVHKCGM